MNKLHQRIHKKVKSLSLFWQINAIIYLVITWLFVVTGNILSILIATIPYPIIERRAKTAETYPADRRTIRRRNRLTDIYLAGGIGKPEYLQRAAEIDHLITQAEDAIVAIEHANSTMTQRLQILQSFSGYADHVPEWLHNANPQEVNRILRALFDHIDIDGETITAITLK